MTKRIYCKYNFVQYQSGILNSYYDKENVVSIHIFKSGWKGKYECVMEWGEYGSSELFVRTAQEIENLYHIMTFSRKEKLIKISESIL